MEDREDEEAARNKSQLDKHQMSRLGGATLGDLGCGTGGRATYLLELSAIPAIALYQAMMDVATPNPPAAFCKSEFGPVPSELK